MMPMASSSVRGGSGCGRDDKGRAVGEEPQSLTIDEISAKASISAVNRYPSALYALYRLFNRMLIEWVMAKYRRFRNRRARAGQYLARIAEARPELFVHWHMGMRGEFI